MRFSRVLILLLIVPAFYQYAYFAPLLPERIASHFDAVSQADGWSSKAEFFCSCARC